MTGFVYCDRCTDGTYTDCNGARWKCHFCHGTRTRPMPYRDADNYDAVQDARAEHRLETGELLPVSDFLPGPVRRAPSPDAAASLSRAPASGSSVDVPVSYPAGASTDPSDLGEAA